jgi:PAS domain S-box-containing protein
MIAMAVSVLLVALLILASIFIGNRLTEPIQKVIGLSSSIAEGDFSQKLVVTSQDEIGKLSNAINEMSAKLDKSIGELEESEERYERLIEFAEVGIIAAENNKIIQVNRKAVEIYGYEKEELLGQPPDILSTKEYHKNHQKILDEFKQSGTVKQTVFEEEGKRKDGSSFPIEISYSLARETEEGTYNVIAIMRDITERKKAEKEIKEARDFMENVISNSVDGIMIVDPQGTITKVNEALKQMLGFTEEELIGKHTSELPSKEPEDIQISSEMIAQLFEKGYIETAEAVWVKNDGSKFPIEVNMVLLKDEMGTVIGGVSSIRDITERKNNQEILKKANEELEDRVQERTVELQESNQQLQWEIKERKEIEQQLVTAKETAESANKAKSDFLANMSHELRTPLNHIIGFTELVLDKNFGDLNDTQSEYLGDVLQSSQHLLSLINDILDLSKVEAGKQELEPTNLDLKELLERSLIMFKEKTLKHGLQLSLDVDHVPDTITADERKLKQVVYNLVANAVKFTPEGGSVTLSACHISSANGHWKKSDGTLFHVPVVDDDQSSINQKECVAISVKDTGIGIEQEDLKRIFNPFEQVDTSSSRKYQGTGLGLSLCRKLVKLHGGILWAESEGEGKGTTLNFIIPT